mmetsp:Transcript_1268/g.2019  ORF Transcript_1268/g.2019 Transcript_1268/m.2019 type:complete len:296 (-) Transcript_1268:341-1228(-)
MVPNILLALTAGCVAAAQEAQNGCLQASAIYEDGVDMFESLWDSAFKCIPRDSPDYQFAYHLVFSDAKANPNDEVTARRVAAGLHHELYKNSDVCHISYFHKQKPGPEPLTACVQYRENACCEPKYVADKKTIKEAYGPTYHWDRCGSISDSCERYFVEEACLYECDVNLGLFRKFPPHTFEETNPDHNEWQIHNMPIRIEYCENMFEACKSEPMCAEDHGSMFSCALVYLEEEEKEVSPILAIIFGILAGVLCCSMCLFVRRERQGNPLFPPIEPEVTKPTQTGSTNSSEMTEV